MMNIKKLKLLFFAKKTCLKAYFNTYPYDQKGYLILLPISKIVLVSFCL